MPCVDEWLTRVLVSTGVLDEPTAEDVRESGVAYASKEIIRRRLLTKEQMAKVVKERYGVDFAEPEAEAVQKMAVSLIPERMCRQHLLVPLRLDGDKIEVLMANPIDTVALDAIGLVSGRKPVPFFGFPDKVDELITEGYSSDTVIFDLLKKLPEETSVQSLEDADPGEEAGPVSIGTPVIRLANALIAQAVRMLASDIHIEHDEKHTMVRYRIDGVLRNMMKVPKYVGEGPLVSRIKIMANLDVADRRRPQDGRAKLLVGSEEIGLRVSTVPTSFGEKAVLRILDRRQAEVPLETLGYRPELLERLSALSDSEQGLVLVTGPTGSGKTTTLYSILNRLKGEDINIVTVEDPIEYRLDGINQIQVHEKAGMDFAAVLRSVLRQDPDVVLIGEIRDRETADIAFQAALTGHMVFSTLHTNDALSTVNRLLDMGVDRYRMAPALIGVVSQRLVRRICRGCVEDIAVDPSAATYLKEAGLLQRQSRGKGCERCGFTGLSGRLAITELLDLRDREARDLLNSAVDLGAFREEALKRGWLKTMTEDALWHLSNGETVLEEIMPYLEAKTSAAPAASAPPAAGPAAPARPPAPAVPAVPATPGGAVPVFQVLAPAAGAPASAAASAAAPKEPAAAASAASAAFAGAPAQGPVRRVLVVDDNPNNRLLIGAALKAEGYQISEAENGFMALQEVVREKPDLMVLDLMMPEMDGFAVVRHLRGEMGMPELPVLVLTAMSEAESQATALEIGADDYLTKPFIPKILRARVKALFRRNEMAGGGGP